MPDTLAAAHSQNVRWERGRLQMARQYVPPLLRRAAQERSFKHLDAALEHLIPPFSALAALSGLAWLASLALPGRGGLARASRRLGLLTVLGQAVYLFSGLWLVRAPAHVYKSLLYTPIFVAWKLLLYLRVWRQGDPEGWIRTRRNEGERE
jgi:hypothetical protein